jgi:hypothetical protein
MIQYKDIDKDFQTLIPYLINKDYKTFASCDGVLANHSDPSDVSQAYISFMYVPKLTELFSLFAQDKDFSLSMHTPKYTESYQYGGNTISGNIYSVYFDNPEGAFTNFNNNEGNLPLDTLPATSLPYFHKIIKSYEDGLVHPEADTLTLFEKIAHTLQNAEQSELCIQISTHKTLFSPFTDKANYLEITTKYGTGAVLNLCELYELLKEKNISTIVSETEPVDFIHTTNDTVLSVSDYLLIVKFEENQFDEVLKIIDFAIDNEHKLSRREIDESPLDDEYEDELDYDVEDYENYDYEI